MAGDQRRVGEGPAVDPWRHRARQVRRSRLAGPAAVLALLLAVLALPPVSSAFSGRTVSSASLAADQLLAPTSLTATWSCGPAAVSMVKAVPQTLPSPLVLTPPAETQPGDLLLAQVTYYGSPTVATPQDWKLLFPAQQSVGNVLTSAVFYKIAVAGEPAVSFYRSPSSGDLVGGIVAYRGVDRDSPFVASDFATGKNTPPTTPAFTTTTATDTQLVHFLSRTGVAALPPLADTAKLWGLSSDSETVTAAEETIVGGAKAQARTTGAPEAEWIAQSVLLRPGKAPTVQLAWIRSPSTWATGYELKRSVGGAPRPTRMIDPVSATSVSDGPRTSGNTQSYELRAYLGSWRSPPATVSITPTC